MQTHFYPTDTRSSALWARTKPCLQRWRPRESGLKYKTPFPPTAPHSPGRNLDLDTVWCLSRQFILVSVHSCWRTHSSLSQLITVSPQRPQTERFCAHVLHCIFKEGHWKFSWIQWPLAQWGPVGENALNLVVWINLSGVSSTRLRGGNLSGRRQTSGSELPATNPGGIYRLSPRTSQFSPKTEGPASLKRNFFSKFSLKNVQCCGKL